MMRLVMRSNLRKQLLVPLILYTAVIIHGTMWPYNFRFAEPRQTGALERIDWQPFSSYSREGPKDIVINFVLFLPFGVLFFLAFGARRPIAAAAAGTFTGMGISLAIEVLQVWLPGRFPSVTDLMMNTGGALAGASTAFVLQHFHRRIGSNEISRAFRKNPLFAAVLVYLAILFVSNCYSLDPVQGLSELKQRLKGFLRSPLLGDTSPSKWFGMALTYGIFSYLLAEWLMTAFAALRGLPTYIATGLACSLAAFAMELLQVVFRSRHPLRSDVFFAVAGVCYGCCLHAVTGYRVFRIARNQPDMTHVIEPIRHPTLLRLFQVHYLALLFYVFVYPMDFSLRNFHLPIEGLVPFYYYISDIAYSSVYKILRPLVLFIPAGIAFAIRIGKHRRQWKKPLNSTAILVFAQLTFEFARAFVSYRQPDITNVIMAGLGAAVGHKVGTQLTGRQD